MRLTDLVTEKIIRHVINNEDYRAEIYSWIDAEFLQFAIKFFERVIAAKYREKSITLDWYKNEFLDPSLPSDDLIIHSGLNIKSVENSFNSKARHIVLKVTKEHFEELYSLIQTFVQAGGNLDFTLTIKFRNVAVDLNLTETLIVVNTLAVKRAQIAGGAWSTAGKQVEKRLMITLCHLFAVSNDHYVLTGLTDEKREVDFFLVDNQGQHHRCEVKLMGKGNPESADVIHARNPDVFVADKLSQLNKDQLTGRNIQWVELRSEQGYRKFLSILQSYGIPATDFEGDVNQRLDVIFQSMFNKGTAEL